ncbi:hypothetical protein J4573_47020 [Actinomadura barringtoniae]|uniref:Uncharacterized protein n=1 Tax=Actinomadura barringtoniae TaxID=1427535 RepID=A0A939PLT9_9ACTN|nr:hypothetical protein [Actinomadura barringtoniae]MBO2454712.1 hypothetical protein [Actinomadura barringtoniae]
MPALQARRRRVTPELATVLRLLEAGGAHLVNVGHGRSPAARQAAEAFQRAWAGEIGAVVSWPARAASWLRPATRLAAGAPDAWVIADTAAGWAGPGRRLAETGIWRASATIAFAGLADPALPGLAGHHATEGLRGAAADGSVWLIDDGALIQLAHR